MTRELNGQLMRAIRRARGYHIIELAEMTGVKDATISNWELGNIAQPYTSKFRKVPGALLVERDFLYQPHIPEHFIPFTETYMSEPFRDYFYANSNVLHWIRKQEGATQVQFAACFDLPGTTYHGYENSTKRAPLEFLEKISVLYDIPLNVLISPTDTFWRRKYTGKPTILVEEKAAGIQSGDHVEHVITGEQYTVVQDGDKLVGIKMKVLTGPEWERTEKTTKPIVEQYPEINGVISS